MADRVFCYAQEGQAFKGREKEYRALWHSCVSVKFIWNKFIDQKFFLPEGKSVFTLSVECLGDIQRNKFICAVVRNSSVSVR